MSIKFLRPIDKTVIKEALDNQRDIDSDMLQEFTSQLRNHKPGTPQYADLTGDLKDALQNIEVSSNLIVRLEQAETGVSFELRSAERECLQRALEFYNDYSNDAVLDPLYLRDDDAVTGHGDQRVFVFTKEQVNALRDEVSARLDKLVACVALKEELR